MLDFKLYGLDTLDSSIIINDLIALANIEKNSIDSRVVSVLGNTIIISGVYEKDYKNKYAVVGGEIVKILSNEITEENTKLTVERQQYGTNRDIQVNSHIRTVVLIDYSEDMVLQNWNFEDTLGNVNNNLFPVELGTGSIQLKSDLKLWSPHSINQKYRVKPRKSMAYIFKGFNGVKFLKFTTVITKLRYNTRGKTEPNKIVLEIKTKLAQWFDKDLVINKQLKGTNPKELFKLIFGLKDDEVYYCQGVTDDSFLKLNNLHTKEYTKVSELLNAYCSNGIRFIFDAKERLKIFSDFKVKDIVPSKVVNYDLTNLMLSENEQMIYNTISTQVFQRQTLYDFKDLDNKYVKYFKKLDSIVDSTKLISKPNNSDYLANLVTIQNEELHKSVQLKDYVILKRTVEPYVEFPAMVVSIDSDYMVTISPILRDKDYKTFNYGKNTYLYDLLVTRSCKLDLYYVRQSLPIVFKYTRNKGNEEIDSNLNFPILPRVNGETKYQVTTNITFGCASNLKVGNYTGIVEEIDKIYGIWDNSKLLYNREIEQFSNENYPPIFVLSNKVNERLINDTTPILNYTHFDNSDLMLEITKPNDNKNDATIILSNTKTVNADIDLVVDSEINRIGNKILEVRGLTNYKLGDVLIVNKPNDLTPQEDIEFDEVLSKIRWRIVGKETQTLSDGRLKHYIFVDSPFAKRQSPDKVYEFTRFPNWSVIYLQELYFRGNPVIEFAQDVVGFSKTTNIDGDTSTELYGEKKYELDSKQLDKYNLRMLMGYILHNFQATDVNTTKLNLPISVFNGIDIETLDVISVIDPVYTDLSQKLKWLVLSTNLKSNTNEVELKLINLNVKDTEPYKIDVKDVLEYKPIEIPDYSHTGGEGNPESNNDGTGGNDVDKTLGQFWLAEVDAEKFRARVEKFEGNYIYFKDFNGTEVEEYKNKLFPVDEFAVTIKGETIFVQSDMNYRAFIKKRRVYNTEEIIITPEDEVTFLVTTTYVDIDGTFFSRKMNVGDGDNYLKVDPITGVKIVGDFVVGENNKNPNNDLWQSLQKNRTFQQPNQPMSDGSYVLREGDIWYDIDDENHAYRYNGSVWISARDGSIVSSKNTVYIQPNEPVGTEGKPLIEGDTWYDSDDGNKPYVYKGGKWINVTDRTLEEAIDLVKKQADESTKKLQDMASDNKITPDEKKQIAKEWEQIKEEYPKILAEGTKFGVKTTNYTISYENLLEFVPSYLEDMTITSDVNRVAFVGKFIDYYKTRQDLLNLINEGIKNSAIKESKSYADKVITALNKDLINQIDGKIDSYNQENDPSETWNTQEDKDKHRGDLWYKPSEKITKRWNGTIWENLDAKDTVAQALAQTKRRVFTVEPTTPYDAGDLWLTDITVGGDLMVCKVSRATGKFVKEDWSIATKYTDDTKAKEAFQNAIKAQSSADGALSQLSDLANDNKLTPVEKQITKKEWETILAEYPRNLEKARLYEVATTEYTSKYNELKLYIEPLLADLTTTSEVIGITFRQHFKDYYDAEIRLTGNIYDKVKESAVRDSKAYADSIDTKLVGYLADGVLTPQEKGDLRSEITTIESRASSIKVRAKIFNVSTDTLTQRVNKLIEWRSGVLSQDGVYSNLQQVNILRQDFRNYYTEEEKVYDGIDKKAKELADKAQSDANGALGLLADIASDNKFTPSEKQSTQKEWEVIVSEYPKNIDQTRVYGVDSSDYTSKYNTLKSYIQPLLANINVTSDINGVTFRTNFKNYYDSRLQLLNTISTKSLEIGFMQNGKMLYLDPTFKEGLNSMSVYDNNATGLITLSRMSGATYGKNPPNDSNMVVAVVKQAGVTAPNMGGFYFGTPTRAGMKLMSKIVAHIPVGYQITWASNETGDTRKEYWVTSREGTGEFREYVHVLECGTTGSFSSTSFFYLTANDGNNSKAITWGISYATVFDAGSNQNDYLTQALGNSKIFYTTTAPTTGMKKNDLWYDTDDGNHPYIYNGSKWVSARDKIFETAGGNKVYFQEVQPPTTGKDAKEGNIWFDTAHNNTMYVLKNDGGGVTNLKWRLANDSLDKINTGRVVLNANTQINGDFKVRGNNVELTADTKIKGVLEVFSNNEGIISYNGVDEASSTQRIIIRGGEIIFQEKV